MSFGVFEPLAFDPQTIYVNEPFPGYVPPTSATSDYLSRTSDMLSKIERTSSQILATFLSMPDSKDDEMPEWKRTMIGMLHDLITNDFPALGIPLIEADEGYASHYETVKDLNNAIYDFC